MCTCVFCLVLSDILKNRWSQGSFFFSISGWSCFMPLIHTLMQQCRHSLHVFCPLVCYTEFSGCCSIVPHTVLYFVWTTYLDHHKAGLIQWLTLKFTLLIMTLQALNPEAPDPYKMLAFEVRLSLVSLVLHCWLWAGPVGSGECVGQNQNSHGSSAKGRVQRRWCRADTKSNGKKYNSSIYGSILSILVPC